MRDDIQESQNEAQSLVKLTEHGDSLKAKSDDSENKLNLLEDELAFNHSLEATLHRLQVIGQKLDDIQQAVLENKVPDAVALLEAVDGQISEVSKASTTRVTGVLSARATNLRSDIESKLTRCWNRSINVDHEAVSIAIRTDQSMGQTSLPNEPVSLGLETTAIMMKRLGMLDEALKQLCNDLNQIVVAPRLSVSAEGFVEPFDIEDHVVSRAEHSSDLSAQAVFDDLQSLIEFLKGRLPSIITVPLAKQLMPPLISRLTSTWLASAVPEDVEGMTKFKNTLVLAHGFGQWLESVLWPGKAELNTWVEAIPDLWLRKRQELSLGEVRNILSRGMKSTETVERAETRVLSQDDEVFAGTNVGDDWNASWSDEEEDSSSKSKTAMNAGDGEIADEEDVSAWGLDDEKDTADPAHEPTVESNADEGADTWGWGDENEPDSPVRTKPSLLTSSKQDLPKANGPPKSANSADRELTLRETYTITSLPRDILDLILAVIADSNTLESSEYAGLAIARSATSLLSIPGLALILFRAGSPSAYTLHPSGNMFLYNDCLWLAERLQSTSGKVTTSFGNHIPDRLSQNLKLGAQKSALHSHGKRAYGKEMESQRTIMADLLDGAQGFIHCTEHPFNQECDIAIASVIDRLRQLNKEWKTVLSQSALLQSLGSLLSTICSKFIVCVEDMPDISEPESQQLTKYSARIIALKDLFNPENDGSPAPDNGQSTSLTALYVPEWLRFQYLAEILESSLADIKYLWIEGELTLYFDTEELVDLIVALFADSPHRRSGVAEIRAAGRSKG